MTRIYNILRAIAVTSLAIAIIVPIVLYVVLSIGAVQNYIGRIAERELCTLLGAEVKIGNVSLSPFNKVLLQDVSVITAPGDTALQVRRLGGGIVLGKLIVDRRLVFSHAEIIGLDARIWRDSADAPLNIQPIIDRLSPKDKARPATLYDLRINNVVIRRSQVSYDVRSVAHTPGRFNPGHVAVRDLKADLLLPRLKNDDFVVKLNRLAMKEESGLAVEALSGLFKVAPSGLAIEDFVLEMPASTLRLGNIVLKYDGWDDLSVSKCSLPFDLSVLDGSVVTPSDFSPFVPELANLRQHLAIEADVSGAIDSFEISSLSIASTDGHFLLDIAGNVSGLPDVAEVSADLPLLALDIEGSELADIISAFRPVTPKIEHALTGFGRIQLAGSAGGGVKHAFYEGTMLTSAGNLDINANLTDASGWHNPHLSGSVVVESLDLGHLLGDSRLGKLTAHVDADFVAKSVAGHIKTVIDAIDYNGYSYNNAVAELDIEGHAFSGMLSIADENLTAEIEGNAELSPGMKVCDIRAIIRDFNPHALKLTDKYEGYDMDAEMTVDLSGGQLENMDGRIQLSRFTFKNDSGDGLELPNLTVMASGESSPRYMLIHSDIFDAQIKGNYRFKEVVPVAKRLLGSVMPVFFCPQEKNRSDDSRKELRDSMNIELTVDIKENMITNNWLKFFKSPVRILQTVKLVASLDERDGMIKLDLEAPYLLNKDKVIDGTVVRANIDATDSIGNAYITTVYPTKKGPAVIEVSGSARDNTLSTLLSWDIEREKEFKGRLNLNALFAEGVDGSTDVSVGIDKNHVVINDTAWVVAPARIDIAGRRISVDNIDVSRPGQYVRIAGDVSDSPADLLCLELRDISLDYVFETLDISNVMFGGVATGTFYATGLLSKEPRLSTPDLHVARMCYNHSLLGDADIQSSWDNENKGINIDAVVNQPNGRKSYIDGAIYPLAESLDFRFKADKLEVGFMKPYMEAFTSEISGYASGDARLYGTFKLIDMTGEIYAEDLKMKLDFTNTYYTTSDSIHLTPGRISFGDVRLFDSMGHSARLDGWVTHKCFKEPEFEFNITDARDFLCFDINEKQSPDWYGRIFCNGVAHVKGIPGFIDINVDMSTAPNSVFTFVLSDNEAADEYTFMTFHDRDEMKGNLLLSVEDPAKAAVKRLKEYYARLNHDDGRPSLYRINLQVNATPDGELILVMDPVGGDRIKARGNGNLRIEYNSADEDMRMFGKYSLTQGSYNFTLQDIIIKDFTIKPGSSISFHGDPLAATLDIDAAYAVNANLSDLDESFLQDRELNRTNVPVHALLKVSGDMQQPDISFDLEFPTLTHDTYRKVKSIISTNDMMNRQIIYLLALNRFYTPDYMASTTKGNELVSVASSTISSQLGSMLGQLSDNWSIAPNIRSDKGDFSDMEVDVALSSYLLNNRLLFNGNFGYRDNALNNNSFIGDFDIEYLLNKSGNIRLKAYNRYNDQNYYMKSALTTQGVGVMFKRDFDDIFSFIKRLRNQVIKSKRLKRLPLTP